MLDFKDSEALFAKKKWFGNWTGFGKGHLNDDYKFIEGCWSYYKNSFVVEGGDKTLPKLWQSQFRNDPDCKRMKPLGDFRAFDFKTTTHKDVYEDWIEKFTLDRVDANGNQTTLIDECVAFTFDMLRKHAPKALLTIDRKRITDIWSILLYNMAEGTYLELQVSKLLEEKYENHPHLYYRPAPFEDESKDVDGIIYKRSDDSPYMRASIKCKGALSHDTIYQYRVVKKKTVPDFYVGVRSSKDRRLQFIRPRDVKGC